MDGPANESLVEKDGKLREQEEKDREASMMYQNLYDQNATEAQIANATAGGILAQAIEPAGRDRSPVEGGCIGTEGHIANAPANGNVAQAVEPAKIHAVAILGVTGRDRIVEFGPPQHSCTDRCLFGGGW